MSRHIQLLISEEFAEKIIGVKLKNTGTDCSVFKLSGRRQVIKPFIICTSVYVKYLAKQSNRVLRRESFNSS